MAGELQNYLRGLAGRLSDDIAGEWAAAVDAELVEPIRAAVPVGKTGHLRQSVRKVQGSIAGNGAVALANSNGAAAGITQWVILAGGPLTTKPVGTRRYKREIKIGSGENTQNVAAGDQNVTYDYALATEFGTMHEKAEPFFYNTARARWPRLRARAEQILTSKLAKE